MCTGENSNHVYLAILDLTCYIYLFDSLLFVLIIVFVLCKRGNWITLMFSIAYAIAYFLKALSFSPWVGQR